MLACGLAALLPAAGIPRRRNFQIRLRGRALMQPEDRGIGQTFGSLARLYGVEEIGPDTRIDNGLQYVRMFYSPQSRSNSQEFLVGSPRGLGAEGYRPYRVATQPFASTT